jgi:hypothetical protein
MKPLTSSFFLLVLCLISCKPENNSSSVLNESPFDVDLFVSAETLLLNGFSTSEDRLELRKRTERLTIAYDYLPGTDLIYTRIFMVSNTNVDTLEIKNWVEENNGLLCSSWKTFSNGVKKAYVQNRITGLIFSLYVKNQSMIIYFDFPDIGSSVRSENRVINSDGSVSIKYSNNGSVENIFRKEDLSE